MLLNVKRSFSNKVLMGELVKRSLNIFLADDAH